MSRSQGSASAFADLYDESVWRVYGFIGYRVRSRQDAEDLTQQTFERALRSWHRFDPGRGDAEAWLIAIARNLVIDHARRQRPEVSIEHPVAEAAFGFGEALDHDLGLDPELAEALEQLSDRERELVALRFGGDLPGPEIAEVTGLSLANVQQILSRAVRKLRAQLARPAARDARSSGS